MIFGVFFGPNYHLHQDARFDVDFSSAQDMNFHGTFISLCLRIQTLRQNMCQIHSILIQNGLFIINFSSIIGRRSLIFVPFDLSRRNEHSGISYNPIAENLIFGVLFGPQYYLYQ